MASSPLSITPFPSFQVPAHQAKWIVDLNWDEEDFAYYKKSKIQNAGQILKPPPIYSNRREQRGFHSAQMILRTSSPSQEKRLAVATIHIFCQRYTTAYIFVSFSNSGKIGHEIQQHSVGSLITLCFFLFRCDQVRLVDVSGNKLTGEVFSWGEARKLLSLPHQVNLFPALKHAVPWLSYEQRIISRGYWDEVHQEMPYYQQLSYIKKREARQSIQSRLSQKKVRRRSLLARIFRPKIDDSIF